LIFLFFYFKSHRELRKKDTLESVVQVVNQETYDSILKGGSIASGRNLGAVERRDAKVGGRVKVDADSSDSYDFDDKADRNSRQTESTMQKKCGNCGAIGHIKTNRECPMYMKKLEQRVRSVIEKGGPEAVEAQKLLEKERELVNSGKTTRLVKKVVKAQPEESEESEVDLGLEEGEDPEYWEVVLDDAARNIDTSCFVDVPEALENRVKITAGTEGMVEFNREREVIFF
jgi:hypothetical protein